MKKKIPFEFILDYLHPLELTIKPLFGCHAIYSNGKILLILRKRENHTEANGIWIATGKEHHESLKKEFHSMISIQILSKGTGETGWQMIPENATDFEEAVIKICAMILNEDERIGKIPNKKK
jgi:hypothetical protein